MTVQNTYELIDYYAGLLTYQYVGKPKAHGTIKASAEPIVMPQEPIFTFSATPVPVVGTFVLSWMGVSSAAINWNDSAATIQTKLRAVTGLSQILVTGSYAAGFTIRMVGVNPRNAAPFILVSSSLVGAGAVPTVLTQTQVDVTLPISVQDAFNVTGTTPAVGKQLDVIGKYTGVSRYGSGSTGQIILTDADFISLIRMAIVKNSAGSSLATIQQLLFEFFPDQILVFDYQTMQMSYLISTTVGTEVLVRQFIAQNLLPKPMGVQVASVIYAPIIVDFFGFRTYQNPAFGVSPFNTYAVYNMAWPWLSYANALAL